MDHQIFLAINGLAEQSNFLDQIGIFFAENFLYFFLILVALLWLKTEWRSNVYAALLSAAVSRGVIVEMIKRMVARPRPFEILQVNQLIEEDIKRSFPSGHAVIYFSLAFAFYGTRLFWPFIFLASLGSLARIFVGVHYPLDVLAGLLTAAVTVFLVRRFFETKKASATEA